MCIAIPIDFPIQLLLCNQLYSLRPIYLFHANDNNSKYRNINSKRNSNFFFPTIYIEIELIFQFGNGLASLCFGNRFHIDIISFAIHLFHDRIDDKKKMLKPLHLSPTKRTIL